MAPLILHNVPDDECYVGEDGVKRPYAIYFNQHEGGHTSGSIRTRRTMNETGSFGKSTRRSRSRTGTPGGVRARENPTLAAADRIFGDWVSNQAAAAAAAQQAQLAQQAQQAQQQQQQQQQPLQQQPTTASTQEDSLPQRRVGNGGETSSPKTPVEMILRGYRSTAQQYAAIAHYEALAGPILEDYPRDPPATQRRWQSALRDPALTQRCRTRRTRLLGPEERALVNRADGGAHWIKVTFESADAANAAAVASPQPILGHLVFAEPYRGLPPARDEACLDVVVVVNDGYRERRLQSSTAVNASRASSQTVDTTTLTPSSVTITEPLPPAPSTPRADNDMFCRRIPSARRAHLLPAEQALLPQPSAVQRFVSSVPFVRWFSGSMIGNEVPRTEAGDFDWARASLYWKCIWWLDSTFGLFGGDVSSVDKDE
ncbi:hypothetical protein L249_0743 [Ophiocordyceps polyrhachis-furcata BCC 54312]|uniref:Nucleoporin NUP53 n=1 Tax=Ophiocordyceps polyrhachis-furcata BCC 54312 TaxID=1330021 RepID=A0A367LCX4_9HYPO|nr:hypothetical protein L249_0743 [Ophiocordyceps polyrhachis-furcata BCC 54312]